MQNHAFRMMLLLAIISYYSPSVSPQAQQPATASKATTQTPKQDLTGVWMKDRPSATALQY